MQSDCSQKDLNVFINSLGFCDFSKELVEIAFTHSSYVKEHDNAYEGCYERLEFLGDAVLKMATTEYLYHHFPQKDEGELTKIRAVIVSDEILYKVAKKIGIENYIKVGKPEKKAGIYKLESVQACVMEALFGALYISDKREKLHEFIIKELSDLIEDIANNNTSYNAKALLQEYTQGESKELPVYNIVEESGEAHNKTFKINVSYKNEILAEAEGKTKKQAQQEAAFIACGKLGLLSDNQQTFEIN